MQGNQEDPTASTIQSKIITDCSDHQELLRLIAADGQELTKGSLRVLGCADPSWESSHEKGTSKDDDSDSSFVNLDSSQMSHLPPQEPEVSSIECPGTPPSQKTEQNSFKLQLDAQMSNAIKECVREENQAILDEIKELKNKNTKMQTELKEAKQASEEMLSEVQRVKQENQEIRNELEEVKKFVGQNSQKIEKQVLEFEDIKHRQEDLAQKNEVECQTQPSSEEETQQISLIEEVVQKATKQLNQFFTKLDSLSSEMETQIQLSKQKLEKILETTKTKTDEIQQKITNLDTQSKEFISERKAKIEKFLLDLIESQAKAEKNFKENSLTHHQPPKDTTLHVDTQVEVIKNFSISTLIGGDYTRTAIKNENSYMVATTGKGFVLYEKGHIVDVTTSEPSPKTPTSCST